MKEYKVGDKTEDGWEIIEVEHNLRPIMRRRIMIVEDNQNHIIKLTIGEMGYHYLAGSTDYFLLDTGEMVSLKKNEFSYSD